MTVFTSTDASLCYCGTSLRVTERLNKTDCRRARQSSMQGKQRTNKGAEGDTEEISISQSYQCLFCYKVRKKHFSGVELRLVIPKSRAKVLPVIQPVRQVCSIYLALILQTFVFDLKDK